jgi:hypothetical protein
MIWIIRHYEVWDVVSTDLLPGGNTDMVNVMVIENIFGDEYINIYILITIIIAIQWVRAISAFYVSRFFGPLIKILANMLIDLVKFMVIMGISFFIFCCIGSTLFRDLTSYANI